MTTTLIEVDYDPFAASAPLARAVPTTEAQREVWLADRLGTEASLAYNESSRFVLRGPLQVPALAAALDALVGRHDALRATISADGLQLEIASAAGLPLEVVDLSALAPDARAGALAARQQQEVETPFALAEGPLVRAVLLALGPDEHVLMLTAHHVVCDGWSLGVLARELGALYSAAVGQRADGLPPAPSFADHASRAREDAAIAADERYWLERHAVPAAPLELPLDRPRPAARDFASRREDVWLDAELIAGLKRLGGRHGASLFGTLLTGFALLMSRLSGQADLVIGVPAAGQLASGDDGLVGHCVNLLPLRLAIDAAAPASSLLADVQGRLIEAFEHQRCTFGTLLRQLPIERDPSRLPLVSVMFNVDQALESSALGFAGLEVAVDSLPRRFENFDLFVNASQVGGALRLECQYGTALFDGASVRGWMQVYEQLLRSLLAAPDEALGRLDALPPSHRDRLARWNATSRAFDRQQTLADRLARQAAATPNAPALRAGNERLDYRALDGRANRLARLLRARGIGRGALVGLGLERGAAMIVAQLAILKSGAAYVPLDPGYPVDRLAMMAEDARLALLVTDAHGAGRFSFPRAQSLWLDAEAAEVAAQSPDPLPADPLRDARAEDPAYVIYTSGSTGRPKGVVVPHAAVVNFLDSMLREPGIAAGDRLVAVTTLSFDIAVLELLGPLSVGAEVVLASRDEVLDGRALKALLETADATLMQATPSSWRMLIDAGWRGGPRFKALVGGEALPADLARQLVARAGEVWNMYGPTETTVWSTCERVTDPDAGIRIGAPIANTSIWMLDAAGRPCPIGVPGEIAIGGDGVTIGYLRRPELTAERFVADTIAPFATGGRLYLTGDRGRWCHDGRVAHLGRLDDQVKLRGHRIELGEIEATLAGHPDVSRAVVIVREDVSGDARLVAYVVPRAAMPATALLLDHLRARLPEYMLPQHLVELSAIPLLPNGKIDRRALPRPAAEAAARPRRSPPSSASERLVAEVMSEVLRLPDLGREDGFFVLGGHSLLAAQLANRLGERLGVAVPMRTIFDAPTVSALAARIDRLQGEATVSAGGTIAVRADQSRAPASLMQQRLWFLEQLNPGRVTYNTPTAHRLKGRLDAVALERAFNEMVRRQAVLRTAITLDASGMPIQSVLPAFTVSLLPAIDLSALPPEERERALIADMTARVGQPMDLGRAPLFRQALYRLADEEHVLFFMVHHIIWDGWSFDLYNEEIGRLYAAARSGAAFDARPLAASYGDFAEWQQRWLDSDDLQRQLAYWKGALAQLPEPLDLPLDRPRPARMSGSGATEWVACDPEQAERLRAFGQRHDATLFMTLLAGYVALLARTTGQTDIVIGTPVRGRSREELEKLMGFFVNALPVRFSVRLDEPFGALVKQVRQVLLDAFEHPDVPFEYLLRELQVVRDEGRSPIYQAFFSFQDARRRHARWADLDLEQIFLFQPGAAEDLGLWFLEKETGLVGGLTYNTDVIAPESARRIGTRYFALLDSVLRDADLPLARLPLLGDDERAAVAAWNDTTRPQPGVANVSALFQAQAARTPDRVALRQAGTVLSYRELDARVNRLAHELRARGIGRGDLVGLSLSRTPEMVVAQQAVLLSGAAYVPLDPGYPAERLATMAADAQLALLVTESAAGALRWPRERALLLDLDAARIAARPAERPAPDPARDAGPEDPAYVIYTSGSTGTPKGVVVPHRAVVNFLASMAREPGLAEGDRLAAVTTLSFDIAVLELMLPLAVGAEVLLISRDEAMDGSALRAVLERQRATVMQATPTTWRLLVEAGWVGGPDFKALIGGEALPADLAADLLERTGALWNMYGPTETTVWSTCWRVDPDAPWISIGRPVANTTVQVRDERGEPCPIGVPGELWIGGAGVALGYLRRDALTAERFVPDPLRPGARCYRTGDRGRWREDGRLEHLGRLDFQVKVRGHRIELGEIEASIGERPEVAQCVAIVREDRPGDLRLVAYVVGAGGATVDAGPLREHLRARLPDYMLPQHIVALPALPLLPNGKIDRKSLPPPNDAAATARTPAQNAAAPMSAAEAAVAAIWGRLLELDDVRASDNFFDLGGHSLLAMRAAGEMEKHLGVRIPVRRLIFESLSQLVNTPAAEPAVEPVASAAKAGFFGRLMRALKPVAKVEDTTP